VVSDGGVELKLGGSYIDEKSELESNMCHELTIAEDEVELES